MKIVKWVVFMVMTGLILGACGSEEGDVTVEGYTYSADVAGFYTENEIMMDDIWEQDESVYLVYFHSPDCPFCVDFQSTLEDYMDQDGAYEMYKVNVDIDRNSGVWEEYRLQGTPALYIINREMNTVEDVLVGALPLEQLPLKE